MLVICLVIWLLSGQMSSEEELTKVLMAKLDGSSNKEFVYTLFALVSVFGVVAIARHFLETGVIHDISSAVMDEFPRTIYFFGANLSSASLMAGIYLNLNPSATSTHPYTFFLYATTFGMVFFFSGYFLRHALNTKKARQLQVADASTPSVG